MRSWRSVKTINLSGRDSRFRRVDSLRAGLNHKQPSGDAILCPLDIHRLGAMSDTRIMLFYDARPSGKLEDLIIREGKS